MAENPEFLCVTPYAPRFPFEMWILPKRHAGYFEESQKTQFEFLAPILSEALRRMDKVLARPSYNFILHSSPLHEKTGDFYHWHIEIIPKLTQVAGFEWGQDSTSILWRRKNQRSFCGKRRSNVPHQSGRFRLVTAERFSQSSATGSL